MALSSTQKGEGEGEGENEKNNHLEEMVVVVPVGHN
jgi:hypothetical protein